MDVEPAVLAEADADDADSLVSENDPDDMANEQTWPTEEEMGGTSAHEGDTIPDAESGTTPKRVRKIPKGMSSYQATWIVDNEEDEDGEGGDAIDEEGEEEMEEVEEVEEVPDVKMDADETETDRRTVQFQDLEEEEEQEQ
jgi:pre-rRNA-processing protein TSR1